MKSRLLTIAVTVAVVALIMLLATALRFYQLDEQPLWMDEVLTWHFIQGDYSNIVRMTSRDVHPPLYYFTTRLWLYGVSSLGIPPVASQDDEWFLRAPSALISVLTVPLVFALGRTIGGFQLGLVTALLFAVSPFQVRYGQEARMYALLTFFAVLAMWGLARLLRSSRVNQPGAERESETVTAKMQKMAWAAYVVGCVGALYNHNTAVFLFGGSNVVVFACLWTGLLRRGQFARNWLIAQVAVIAFWGPWLPQVVSQSQQVVANYWIPYPDLDFVTYELRKVQFPFGASYTPELSSSSFSESSKWLIRFSEVLMIGFGCIGLFRWRKSPRWAVLSLTLLLAPIVGLLLVSQIRPIFLARTLIWTTIPFSLLVAAGALYPNRRSLRILVVSSLVGLNLWGASHYFMYYQKPADWDKLADYVAREVNLDDLILFYPPTARFPFRYYFRKHDKDVNRQVLRGTLTEVEEQIRSLPPHKRLWWVYRGFPGDHEPVLEMLQGTERLVDTKLFRKAKVFLFRSSSAGMTQPDFRLNHPQPSYGWFLERASRITFSLDDEKTAGVFALLASHSNRGTVAGLL